MMLNLKGGVAKTTNAVAIAECFASRGKRILLIDADHQCMASELLLGADRLLQAESRRTTLHDLLANMLTDKFDPGTIGSYVTDQATNIIHAKKYLSCIPCSHRIDEFSTNMSKARRGHQSNDEFLKRLSRLKRVFTRWLQSNYYTVIIDSPPSFALQVLFLFSCSDYYILPSVPDRLSVRGSLTLIDRLSKRGFTRTQCLGTLWSMFRKQIPRHVRTIQESRLKEGVYACLPQPFNTVIPNMSVIADALDCRDDVGTFPEKYRYQSAGLFFSLCREIEERIETIQSQ